MGFIHKFSIRRVQPSGTSDVVAQLAARFGDVSSWRDYYIEFENDLSSGDVDKVANSLVNPALEAVAVDETVAATAVGVSYKRGIVDNENDSIRDLCAISGVPAKAARVARMYSSKSTTQGELAAAIQDLDCNANIEDLYLTEPHFETLAPIAEYERAQFVDLSKLDDVELAKLGKANGRSLELDKMHKIVEIQNKLGLNEVSDALLESLDARWSDHCSHTTWKAAGELLKVLMQAARDTNNKNIVSMFHDNAGIWDFYDGYGIALKAETHNGPTAVSAYFGQLTKIGGVLRDILGTGKGADPIGVFEYSAIGKPDSKPPIPGRPTPRRIANETIRAVKEYGNTFGVAMMSSKMAFNNAYRAKPFALGGSIGLIQNKFGEKGRPQPGDMAIILGGLTGNDGIHGASASSAGVEMDTTSVQIGSPLEEIKFREAILELRDAGIVRAVTDMGAAGVNSAFGEMGEECGIWINTALVPLKTSGLAMWRILISESQERMALAVAPENLDQARAILQKHNVRSAVVGRFTDDQRFSVVHDISITEQHVIEADVQNLPAASEIGFSLPYELASYKPQQFVLGELQMPTKVESVWPMFEISEQPDIVEGVMGDLRCCNQEFASSQYDSSVGGRTFHGPQTTNGFDTGYWAAKPLYDSDAAVVFASAFNPELFEANPLLATRQGFLRVLLQQVLAGVAPDDICFSDNFYTPYLADQSYEWLRAMVHELGDLSRRYKTPFISGKDSSAGSVTTPEGIINVPPAVFLAALGKVSDAAVLREETWKKPGNVLVQIGIPTPSLAGTVAVDVLKNSGNPNDVDEIPLDLADQVVDAFKELPSAVVSARMIESGGVLATLIKGALDAGMKANLQVSAVKDLISENRLCALVEIAPQDVELLPQVLSPRVIASLSEGIASVVCNGVELLTDEVRNAFNNSFAEALQ